MRLLNWSAHQAVWRLFPLVISISFAMDVYVPALPLMGEYFHATRESMQASLYLFMLTVAVSQLLIGPLADRFGRRTVALATAVLFLLGSILCALADSLLTLLVGRVIQAMGACGTYLISFIVVRDNFSTRECGRLFSLLGGVNSIVASLAPIIGGILLDLTHNWRSGFDFLCLLGFCILVAVQCNIPNYAHTPKKELGNQQQRWRNIINNAYFKCYTLIACSGLLGLYLFCALSPEILINKLQVSGTQYGLWFGLNAATVFIGNLIAARLTNTLTLEKIVQIGLSITLFACSLMLCLNLVDTSELTFMMPMLMITLGIGMSMGCSIALALRDFETNAGKATALISASQFGFSALVGGLIVQFDISPLSLAIPVLLVSLVGIKLVNRR